MEPGQAEVGSTGSEEGTTDDDVGVCARLVQVEEG